jgi:hypothetical protein
MLECCLSLLFSHFNRVGVRYAGYATTTGEPLHARPSLLFQNVDESGDLHFDLIPTLPGFPVDFARKYDIARVAVVNEAEKAIVVREFVHVSLEEERAELIRALNRCRKQFGQSPEAMLYRHVAGKRTSPNPRSCPPHSPQIRLPTRQAGKGNTNGFGTGKVALW